MLNPDKTFHEPRRREEVTVDRSKTSSLGWLKKPTALFGNHSTPKTRVPPRMDRGASSATRGNSPGLAGRAHSPAPSPPRVASPQRIQSVSPRTSDNSSSSTALPSSPLGSRMDPPRGSGLSAAGRSPTYDSTATKEALEELRREVKGLQEAFNSLKKEHGELRGELRVRQSSEPGPVLPVDAFSINRGKQDAKSTGKGASIDLASVHGHGGMLPIEDMGSRSHRTPEPPVPHASGAGADENFFESIMESCGFGFHNKKALKDNAAVPSQPNDKSSSSRPSSRGITLPSAPADTSAGTPKENSYVSPLAMEGGGSSSSMSAARAPRWPSPHDREVPMDGRSNSRSGSKRANDVSMPGFGSGGQLPQEAESLSADRQLSADSEVPHFGKPATSSNQAGRPPSISRSTGNGSQGSPSHRTWKAPQAGQPLVLPFPDLDDGDSETFSPGAPPLSDVVAAQTASASMASSSVGTRPPVGTLDFAHAGLRH
jgi:hypothetical protein